MVSDGQRLTQTEQREARLPQPRSVAQLVRALNKARRNNTLYVKLLELRRRRRRQRRAAVVAAAVGARGARSRPQRREFNPLEQRDARRMGTADRPRDQRRADADHSGLAELVARFRRFRELFTTCLQSRWRGRRWSSRRSSSALPPSRARLVAEVLPGRDPGRLPEGRRREPLDRQPRAAGARARHRAGLRNAVAVSVDGRARARRIALHRHRQRRRVFRVDAARQGRAVLRRGGARGPRAWRPAPNGGLYVGTSPDGKIYKVDRNGAATTFFDPEEKYIWALAIDAQGQRLRRHRRKGRRLQDHARRQGRAVLPDQGDARDGAGVRQAGNLLVGTESPGRVLRVDADGKAFLLLDSPFQEIRTLRFDDKGVLYVAAVNGRATSGAAPSVPTDTGAGSAGPTPRARRCRRCRSRPRSPRSPSSTRRARAVRARSRADDRLRQGRDLSHRARRPVGSAVGIARRFAVRPGVRRRRPLIIAHRQQGQDLPARRRSAAADAARARQRAAGDGALQGRARPPVLRDRESRASCSGCRRRAPRAAPTSPKSRDAQMVSTWGAISWRGDHRRRQPRRDLRPGRATPKRPTTRGAPGRRPTRPPKARRSPARRRATSSGARC